MKVWRYYIYTFCFYGLFIGDFELLRPIVGGCKYPFWPVGDSSGDYFNAPDEAGPVEAVSPQYSPSEPYRKGNEGIFGFAAIFGIDFDIDGICPPISAP